MYDDSYKPMAKEALEKLIEQNTLLLGRFDQSLFRRLIEMVDEPRPSVDPREVAHVASTAASAVGQAIACLNSLALFSP